MARYSWGEVSAVLGAGCFIEGGQCASEASRLRDVVTFLGERSEPVTPAAGERFLGLTARKTSRCNLAIEISFVLSSQSNFNFSVLRGTQVDFLLVNLLRPGPGATLNAPGWGAGFF